MDNYENRHRRFLSENESPYVRYHSGEKEEKEDKYGLLKSAGKVALAAYAIRSIGYHTGGTRQVNRFLMAEGAGLVRAMREASSRDAGGWMNVFSRDTIRRAAAYGQESRRQMDRMANRTFQMQKHLEGMRNALENEIPLYVQEELRREHILRRLSSHAAFTREMLDETKNMLEKFHPGVLAKAQPEEDLFEVLERSRILTRAHHQEIVREAQESLRHDFRGGAAGAARIAAAQEKFREAFANQMARVNEKRGVFGALSRADQYSKGSLVGDRKATVNDILELHSAGRIKMNADDIHLMQDLARRNRAFGESVFDKSLYVHSRGTSIEGFTDYAAIRGMFNKHVEWWSTTNVGHLFKLQDYVYRKKAKENASVFTLRAGSVNPVVNALVGRGPTEQLGRDYMFVNGKIFRMVDEEAINEGRPMQAINRKDVHLISSRFGSMPRMMRDLSGADRINTEDKTGIPGLFERYLDAGSQDSDAAITSIFSSLRKFGNPDWDRNFINRILQETADYNDYRRLNRYLNRNLTGLDARVLNRAIMDLDGAQFGGFQARIASGDFDMANRDHMLEMFEFLADDPAVAGMSNPELTFMFSGRYNLGRNKFLSEEIPLGESDLITGSYSRTQTGFDKISREVSVDLIHRLAVGRSSRFYAGSGGIPPNEDSLFLKRFLDDARSARGITDQDVQDTEEAFVLSLVRERMRKRFRSTDDAMIDLNELLQGTSEDALFVQQRLRSLVKKTNPITERFSEQRPHNVFETDYLVMNNVFENNFMDTFTTREGITSLVRQLNPFTGARNMEDVSTLTLANMFVPYRLQAALSNVGMGFTSRSMDSTANLWGSLFTKRIIPGAAAWYYGGYINDKVEDFTGESLTDLYQKMRFRGLTDQARERDEEGRTEELKRKMEIRQGIEQLGAFPIDTYVPFIGDIVPGNIVSSLFFNNTPVRKTQAMSEEEMIEYAETGEDEFRKGRFWALGSKTPYQGDRVTEFQPNALRMAISDWEYSSVTSSKYEKYSHSFLPTLENPFGGLRDLIPGQAYWWEKKHYEDRPYMLTGSYFNDNTMFFGDVLNGTIGKIVKPVKQMHQEYWGDPVAIRQQQEMEDLRPDSPVNTMIYPAGRVQNVVFASPSEYGSDYASYRVNPEILESIGIGKSQKAPNYGYTGMSLPATEGDYASNEPPPRNAPLRPEIQAFVNARDQQTTVLPPGYMPQRSEEFSPSYVTIPKSKGGAVIYGNQSGEAVYAPKAVYQQGFTESSLFDLSGRTEPLLPTVPNSIFSVQYDYKKEVEYQKLMGIQDPRSLSYQQEQMIDNFTEPLGIWKWMLMTQAAGYDPSKGDIVIQKADEAYNMSNDFWETGMGSFGGQISEIGRRFLRRDSSKIQQYNPIRNMMPEWMPGTNYFIDFKHGDPYAKIDRGEYRLPGEAYEKINELHPDETGAYGAFDKFKILADVAPWSEEYKYWKDYATKYIKDKDVKKEMSEIKRQVSKKKKKYEFESNRFRKAEIVREQVTVSKMLDDYTFLTEEYGNKPIRLAGVQVKKNAEGALDQFFEEGQKIEIGVAADPTQREAEDTYGTIRAVVFDKMKNINYELIRQGIMVENKNDNTPAGIAARFSPKEIGQGKRWEFISHLDTPFNTKFLNVRSAVEEYERTNVYGVEFATWDKYGFEDYFIPGMQNYARYGAAAGVLGGGLTGFMVSAIFLGKGPSGKRNLIGAGVGAGIGLALSSMMKKEQQETGKAWIPERRRTENEINEYYDILKYVKFSGLYEKGKSELKKSGFDIDKFLEKKEKMDRKNADLKRALEKEKRSLYKRQPRDWEFKRAEINRKLELIQQNKDNLFLPDEVRLVLYYKEQAEQTLYGLNPYGDRQNIMKALPYKDKPYFNEFADADLADQSRLSMVLPDNLLRVYKTLWGYGAEPPVALDEYFMTHHLPDANWEGWAPEYDLESFKVKTVKREGLDLNIFNFWEDDVESAKMVGDLGPAGNSVQRQMPMDYGAMRNQIITILEGKGLQNVRVTMTPNQSGQVYINMRHQQNKEKEIEMYYRENMDKILS